MASESEAVFDIKNEKFGTIGLTPSLQIEGYQKDPSRLEESLVVRFYAQVRTGLETKKPNNFSRTTVALVTLVDYYSNYRPE